jgi:hypothetical protein
MSGGEGKKKKRRRAGGMVIGWEDDEWRTCVRRERGRSEKEDVRGKGKVEWKTCFEGR